jgi:hypothetical protein
MTDQSAPIYNDRDIGSMRIQTARLVDALLGQGGLGSIQGEAKYGCMSMAAKILSDHPAIMDHPDFEPETVVKAIRDAAWHNQHVAENAVTDRELSSWTPPNPLAPPLLSGKWK